MTAAVTPGREVLKAREANMRDLASDLEVARDAYLTALESQNPDALAERREVLARMLWDDKGLIIDALRLATKPADEGEPVEPEELEALIADRSANRAADAILANYVLTRRSTTGEPKR